MSTSVLRTVLGLAAIAALSSLGACTQNTAIGHLADAGFGPPGSVDGARGPRPIDPGPDCTLAANVFADKGCIGCHGGTGVQTLGAGFDMEAAGWQQRLVGVSPSPNAPAAAKCGGNGPYLVAGKLPATGLFLDKLRPAPPCGVQMPQVGGKLNANEFECIQRWANNVVAAAGGFEVSDAGPPDVGSDSLDPGLGCTDASQVFANKGCVACHGGSGVQTLGGGFDFETQPLGPRLVGVSPSPNGPAAAMCRGKGPYLVAGRLPATGLFLDKLRNSPPCGVQMPQVGPKLTATELACVQRWADQLVAAAGGVDAGTSAPDAQEPPFSIAPEFVGTWVGYFEAFNLPSGSDVIKISLQQMAEGPGRIEVTLGPEMALPPVTDPSAPWPTAAYTFGSGLTRVASYLEGFSYAARTVQWNGRRLRFVLAGAEPWQPWCSRQMVYYTAESRTGYSCIPGPFPQRLADSCWVDDAQGNRQTISCARALMCSVVAGYCDCYGDGCTSSASPTASFDMTFDSTGTAINGTGLGANIRLMKTAP